LRIYVFAYIIGLGFWFEKLPRRRTSRPNSYLLGSTSIKGKHTPRK